MDDKVMIGRVDVNNTILRDSYIWRYLGFEKFMDFILNRKMWFSKITEFKDKTEGHISENNLYKYLELKIVDNKINSEFTDINTDGTLVTLWGKERYEEIREDVKKVFVSCWNESKTESELMWLAYGGCNNSVSIRTTCHKLIKGVNNSNDYINNIFWFDFDEVKYINHSDMKINGLSRVEPAFWKGQRFKDEREIRLVAYIYEDIERDNYRIRKYSDDCGAVYGINVDLSSLEFDVIVSPYADEWFYRLVVELGKIHNYNVVKR